MSAQAKTRASGSAFSIARTFDAPRAEVWRAWSQPEALAQWWGPKGCKIEISALEFRPGGLFHYAMNFADGQTMWGRFLYREIAAPQKLAWLNSFSNPNCGIARAPFSDKCPLEILNTVTFEDRGERTLLSLDATPFGAVEDELAFFENLRPSLNDGYGGTLDQLAEHLARR